MIVMGQEAEVFARHGHRADRGAGTPLEAPARRRRWFDDGHGHDGRAARVDLRPRRPRSRRSSPTRSSGTSCALRLRAADRPPHGDARAGRVRRRAAAASEDDWSQLAEAWGDAFASGSREVADRRLNLRIRMLGGSPVGYARMTRRWWAPVRATLAEQALGRPPDVLRLLQPALDGQPRHRRPRARARPRSSTGSSATGPSDLRDELAALPRGPHARARGRTSSTSRARDVLRGAARRRARSAAPRREERAVGVTHISSRDRAARVRPGDRARPARPARARPAARRRRRRASSRAAAR